MSLSAQFASDVRSLYFDGGFVGACIKDHVADLTWEEAARRPEGFNSIAMLVFHLDYYVRAVTKVLQGGPLDAHDKYSFDCPVIASSADWESLRDGAFANAEIFAALIEKLSDDELQGDFVDGKYGTWFRNLLGLLEHSYYHMGQMALIRKMVKGES